MADFFSWWMWLANETPWWLIFILFISGLAVFTTDTGGDHES